MIRVYNTYTTINCLLLYWYLYQPLCCVAACGKRPKGFYNSHIYDLKGVINANKKTPLQNKIKTIATT